MQWRLFFLFLYSHLFVCVLIRPYALLYHCALWLSSVFSTPHSTVPIPSVLYAFLNHAILKPHTQLGFLHSACAQRQSSTELIVHFPFYTGFTLTYWNSFLYAFFSLSLDSFFFCLILFSSLRIAASEGTSLFASTRSTSALSSSFKMRRAKARR